MEKIKSLREKTEIRSPISSHIQNINSMYQIPLGFTRIYTKYIVYQSICKKLIQCIKYLNITPKTIKMKMKNTLRKMKCTGRLSQVKDLRVCHFNVLISLAKAIRTKIIKRTTQIDIFFIEKETG